MKNHVRVITTLSACSLLTSAPLMAANAADASAEPVALMDQQINYQMRDAFIEGRLLTAYLLSEHINPLDVDIEVERGVVRLRGFLPTDVQRDLAIEIARGVDEVEDVHSDIIVDADQATAQSGQSDAFARRFKDATTTARVKTRLLWNEHTNGLGINVDTADQVVTLSGEVGSKIEIALAEQIAVNTDGVEGVRNRLRVAPGDS